MDILNPTKDPKDLVISRAIDQAVENFIEGNIEEADRCFEMAEEFTRTPSELFAPLTTT